KMLNDPRGLLKGLFGYDKDNIKESIIKKTQKYIAHPDFLPHIIAKKSVAATSLCMWVRAMDKYHHVAKNVEPKRQKLAAAKVELAETQASLAETQAKLEAVMGSIAALEAHFAEQLARKEELARQVADTESRLDRAHRLMDGLGGERVRWGESIETLQKAEDNLVGDVIFAAGAIAYQGAFTAAFRHDLNKAWETKLGELGIKHSTYDTGLNVCRVLGGSI
ncbi:dynein heavy chain, partial [Kipferlia bialata]